MPRPATSLAELARDLSMTSPAHVVAGVRALALDRAGPRIRYGTVGRWVASTVLKLWLAHSDLCLRPALPSPVTVNCVDLAALCQALLVHLGAPHEGLSLDRTDGGALCHDPDLYRLAHRAAGCDGLGLCARCFAAHTVLRDADHGSAVIDPTLGFSPEHALTALCASAYVAAAFPRAQNVNVVAATLYSHVETAPPPSLPPHVATRWAKVGLALAAADPLGFAVDPSAPARGEASLCLAGGALAPAEGAAADVLLQVVQVTAAQLPLRPDLMAASAVPPMGAPAKWRAPADLRERARSKTIRKMALDTGEVLLWDGAGVLARIQPLHREAGLARDLAVARALEALSVDG